MNEECYNRIKAVLAEKNITNIQLAEGLGVTTVAVSSKQPSIETLFHIAECLDIDVRELLVSSKESSKSNKNS